MNAPTRVFIAEQAEPALLMLALYLEQFDDIEIVGTAITRPELEDEIKRVKPDVVIYNVAASSENLPALIKQLKTREHSPALICIKEGNFLPLESTFKRIPEALLPSYTSIDGLLETIRRSAAKYRGEDEAIAPELNPIPLQKAG